MSILSVRLETIDPATKGWLELKRFKVTDPSPLAQALGLDAIELNCAYELAPEDMVYIEQAHQVAFADKSLTVIMSVDHGTGDRRYDEQASHTGRELLLMLRGKKPFAHFSRIDRPEEKGIVPEALFEPHVQSGRFVKEVDFGQMTHFGPLLKIYYAVPGEAWRIEAYRTLWRLAEKHGWNDGFEKFEGFLLGYETDIDPFFDLVKTDDEA